MGSGTSSGKVELRVWSGASGYQTQIQDIITAQPAVQSPLYGFFTMADMDQDGKPDLVLIVEYGSGTGKVDLHAWSAKSNFQTNTISVATGQSQMPDANHGQFSMADTDGDGIPDMVLLYNGSGDGHVDLHVWSAKSNFQTNTVSVETGQPQLQSPPNGTLTMFDMDGDGVADMVLLLANGSGTGDVEVHAWSAKSNFQTHIVDGTTAEPAMADPPNAFLAMVKNYPAVNNNMLGPDGVGLIPFGSFSGGPDVINNADLNIHFSIPIVSRAGRGQSFSYGLAYDSMIWTPSAGAWMPSANWGWSAVTQAQVGYIGYQSHRTSCTVSSRTVTWTVWDNFQYVDPGNVPHPIPMTISNWQSDSGCGPGFSSSGSGTATDNSGYSLGASVASGTLQASVTAVSGIKIQAPLVDTSSQGPVDGSGSITDANGNVISVVSGNPALF